MRRARTATVRAGGQACGGPVCSGNDTRAETLSTLSIRTILLATALAFAPVLVPCTRAAEAGTGLADCDSAAISAAGIKHASGSDVALACEAGKARLGFGLQAPDLQSLVDVAVAASMVARKRGFELSVAAAAANVADIVAIRGLAADRDGFARTVQLVGRIDIGTDGVVSPAVLLLQLHASGTMAKTMSDDGLVGFAAMVSAEEKRKVAAASFADQQPTSAAVSGDWRVAGRVMMGGHAATCAMRRATKSVSGEFSYDIMVVATSRVATFAFLTVPTTLPPGSSPKATVQLDGRKFVLPAKVTGDAMRVDLPANTAALGEFVDAFRHAKSLRISVAGKKAATEEVDLAGASAAFEANGSCLNDALARATAEMARGGGN